MLPRRLSNNVTYVSAGEMTERVTLLRLSESRTTTGKIVNSHDPIDTVWGKVEALTYKYTEKTEQVVSESTHRVTIHFRPDITSANLVQMADGQVWQIEAALDPDKRKVNLHLFCYARNL